MRVADLPDISSDFDLDEVRNHLDWRVEHGTIATVRDACAASKRKVLKFFDMYRRRGVRALPPVIVERWPDGAETILTGAHRLEAAWRAGIATLPTYVIIRQDG